MTTDINIINVNGLDYPIKDQEARDIAESAVTMFAYYEDGLVASQAYSTIGTLIFWKDALYETIATVAKGNIWQVGVNLSPSIKAGAILSELKDELTANGNRIYMDYQNGKYGYNTSPTRGADTFFPFKSEIATQDFTYSITVSKRDSGTWYEVTGSQTIDVALADREIVGYGIISDQKTFDNSSPERSYTNSLSLTGTRLTVTITVGIGNDGAASATHTLIVRVFYQ